MLSDKKQETTLIWWFLASFISDNIYRLSNWFNKSLLFFQSGSSLLIFCGVAFLIASNINCKIKSHKYFKVKKS